MAMFGLKEVLDPLAKEVREFGTDLLGHLGDIREALDTQVELTMTTNRLLAGLLDAQSGPAARQAQARAAEAVKPGKRGPTT